MNLRPYMNNMSETEHTIPNSSLLTPHSPQRQLVADLTLLVVVAVWGATFIMVKDAVSKTAPLLFLSVRYGWATLALGVLGLLQGKLGGFTRQELRGGVLAGLALWAGFAFQTIGLQYTSASNAGFIVGLSVALVPIFSFFLLRYRPSLAASVGVVIAVIGLTLLSVQDNFNINGGDWLEIISATAFGVQIVLVARYAKDADPLRLALVEIVVAGVLSLLSSTALELPAQGWWLPPTVLLTSIFMGVVATAAAFTAQATAQRFTSPIHTALIFTLEPVFAAAFAFFWAGETLSGRQLIGCALILVGMLAAELTPYFRDIIKGLRMSLWKIIKKRKNTSSRPR